jgi:GntR family transcriptional repressor for pyruvate dehydrogenase complex
MRNLKPVKRVTIGEQVALELAGIISDGRWAVGQKLPSESALCQALSVGRSTLREALKSLAFIGMVRMRAGDGTYVAEKLPGLLDRILARGILKTEKDLADVCETRLVLETELAALAAERATPADIEALRDLLDQSKLSLEGKGKPFIELDLEFHLAIAAAARNNVLKHLISDIRGVLVEWIMKSQELPGLRENALQGHEKIFQSIVNHNPVKARESMEEHLSAFQRAYTLLGRIVHARTPGAEAENAIRETGLSQDNSSKLTG